MDVGFVGLGRMGLAMARNIVKGGHRVVAWNRSPLDAEGRVGLEIAGSPSDALQADVAFTMLADDSAIRSVLVDSGALADARTGLVHVVASTISVAFGAELADRHAALKLGYLSAPVFGRPDAAAAAQLNVVAAGEAASIEKARPLFELISRKIFVLGENPKLANAAKVAGNMMLAMAIEAMGEAVTLTSAHGLAPEDFLGLMLETLFDARAYKNYAPNIINGEFEPKFLLSLGLKDLNLAEAARVEGGKALPMLDAVRGQMRAALEAGYGDKDWSAVAGYTMRG